MFGGFPDRGERRYIDTTYLAFSPSSTVCSFSVNLRCSYRWVPPCLCQLLSALPRCTYMSSTGPDECPSSMQSCPLYAYALGLTASCCLGPRWPCWQHWFPHCWFLRWGPVGIPGSISCSIARCGRVPVGLCYIPEPILRVPRLSGVTELSGQRWP